MPISELSKKWITGDGGPLILMEKRLLSFWEGADEPSNGRAVEAESRWGLDVATDYDRACDIRSWAGVIEVGSGRALVLSTDGDAMATWLPPVGISEGVIIEWAYADSEDQVISEAYRWLRNGSVDVISDFEVETSPLVLFVSAEAGSDTIYDRQIFEIQPGPYEVASGGQVTDTTSVVCHRFRLKN